MLLHRIFKGNQNDSFHDVSEIACAILNPKQLFFLCDFSVLLTTMGSKRVFQINIQESGEFRKESTYSSYSLTLLVSIVSNFTLTLCRPQKKIPKKRGDYFLFFWNPFSFSFLLFGPPLGESPHPATPHLHSLHLGAHVADTPLAGPLPSHELEQVANPLPPPQRCGTGLDMLDHALVVGAFPGSRSRGQSVLAHAVSPWSLAIVKGHLRSCVLFPRGKTIAFKFD